jgi:hypothetical protein
MEDSAVNEAAFSYCTNGLVYLNKLMVKLSSIENLIENIN